MFHFGTEYKKMAALLAYMEFQFEACFQVILQLYITDFHYGFIRISSNNQLISLLQSYATIIITMSNVWIPQLVGTREYVPTLKTKVWQFCLNFNLFITLMFLFWWLGLENHYVKLFIALLYSGMCSTLLLHTNCCKFFNPNRLKSCLLTLLFLVKFILMIISLCATIYLYIQGTLLDIESLNPVLIFQWILSSITICMDAFFVYIFGKSAFKKHSISSIWSMELAIISKPLFCSCIFLSSCSFVSWALFLLRSI